MELFETDKGLVNAAHVVRVKRIYPKDYIQTWVLYDAEGEILGRTKKEMADLDYPRIEGTPVSAPPGFSVIRLDEGNECWEEPVVAFYIGAFGTTPVTLDGAVRDLPIYGIKKPDGTITIPNDADFSTFEAFRACVVERNARMDARQQAAEANDS